MSSDRHEIATLRDVARRAGVSTATASRVVTGSARVRGETRERTAVLTLRGLIGGQSGAMPDVQYRPRLRIGGSTAPV